LGLKRKRVEKGTGNGIICVGVMGEMVGAWDRVRVRGDLGWGRVSRLEQWAKKSLLH
jgi:hypothetical protein